MLYRQDQYLLKSKKLKGRVKSQDSKSSEIFISSLNGEGSIKTIMEFYSIVKRNQIFFMGNSTTNLYIYQ